MMFGSLKRIGKVEFGALRGGLKGLPRSRLARTPNCLSILSKKSKKSNIALPHDPKSGRFTRAAEKLITHQSDLAVYGN